MLILMNLLSSQRLEWFEASKLNFFYFMTYSSNIGVFDFTYSKARLNGRVLDKCSLIAVLLRLDFDFFLPRLMYDKSILYGEIVNLAESYLSVDLDV